MEGNNISQLPVSHLETSLQVSVCVHVVLCGSITRRIVVDVGYRLAQFCCCLDNNGRGVERARRIEIDGGSL